MEETLRFRENGMSCNMKEHKEKVVAICVSLTASSDLYPVWSFVSGLLEKQTAC